MVTGDVRSSAFVQEGDVTKQSLQQHQPHDRRRRVLLDANATLDSMEANGDNQGTRSTNLDDATVYKLPRIEVQFLCGHEIRPNFNVSEVFQTFFQESINHFFNQRLDILNGNYRNWTNVGDSISNVTVVSKNDFDLYSAVSISGIRDVNSQRWYFPLCNESSPQVLATMDVRGYVFIQPPYENDNDSMMSGNYKHMMDNNHQGMGSTQSFMDYFQENMDQKTVHAFFQDRVCHDLDFMRSKIVQWDDASYPPPTNGQHVKEYQPSRYQNSQHYNHHHFFDHNLYLLCGGADDITLDDDDDIDQGFLMFGMLVGMVMVTMICSELQQYGSTLRRARGSRNDGYAVQPTQEVEMV
jgi:hypothetical protein